jgi:hypothetical protein
VARRFSLWQKVVALAPLLLLLAYIPGEMMLRCRMDGLLRPACCCANKGQADASPNAAPSAVLKAQSCCAREATRTDQPPSAEAVRLGDRDPLQTAVVAFVASSIATLSPPAARLDWAWQRHGPVDDGPPIVLLKHAFLI